LKSNHGKCDEHDHPDRAQRQQHGQDRSSWGGGSLDVGRWRTLLSSAATELDGRLLPYRALTASRPIGRSFTSIRLPEHVRRLTRLVGTASQGDDLRDELVTGVLAAVVAVAGPHYISPMRLVDREMPSVTSP
jgi:hypothetical protein